MTVALTDRPDGVTICIPNWNHRPFLPRSVGSARKAARVLDRHGVASEIIVIDDASRDGSQRALAAIAAMENDILIDVILRPQNQGLAAARNLGLDRAQYKYVCFLDADNEIIAENIHYFVRSIMTTQAAVVYGNIVCHDGHKAKHLISNLYVDNRIFVSNYVDAFSLCDADKVRHCGGYSEDESSHEDWELYLHLIAEGEKIVFVPVCFGYYFIVPHSMLQTEPFAHSRIKRIFAQRLSPKAPPVAPRWIFHPDVGWL